MAEATPNEKVTPQKRLRDGSKKSNNGNTLSNRSPRRSPKKSKNNDNNGDDNHVGKELNGNYSGKGKSKISRTLSMESIDDSSAIDNESSNTIFSKEINLNNQINFLKLFHYFHQSIHLMVEHEKPSKYYMKWIAENLDLSFHNIFDKVFDSSTSDYCQIFAKKFKTWKELRETFEKEQLKKHIDSKICDEVISNQQNVDNDDNNMIEENNKDEVDKENPENNQNAQDKSWASRSDRPRRSCTLKNSPIKQDQSSGPSPKKQKTLTVNKNNNDYNGNNKNIEKLVVNCDPFNLLKKSPKKLLQSSSINDKDNANKQPPSSVLGDPIRFMPQNVDKNTNSSTTTISVPQQSGISIDNNPQQTPQTIVGQNINNLHHDHHQATIPSLFSLNQPEPVRGKVLLINSIPCLVQNGDSIQLPMIPSTATATSRIHSSPVLIRQSTPPTSINNTSENRIKIIKIEEESDSDELNSNFPSNVIIKANNNINNNYHKDSSIKMPTSRPVKPTAGTWKMCNNAVGNSSFLFPLVHHSNNNLNKTTSGTIGGLLPVNNPIFLLKNPIPMASSLAANNTGVIFTSQPSYSRQVFAPVSSGPGIGLINPMATRFLPNIQNNGRTESDDTSTVSSVNHSMLYRALQPANSNINNNNNNTNNNKISEKNQSNLNQKSNNRQPQSSSSTTTTTTAIKDTTSSVSNSTSTSSGMKKSSRLQSVNILSNNRTRSGKR